MRNQAKRGASSLCIFIALLFLITPAVATAKTTSNPNHKGWSKTKSYLEQVDWKPIKSKCDKCQKITAQYNQTVQALLMHRYWVKQWSDSRAKQMVRDSPFSRGKGEIKPGETFLVAIQLELLEINQAELELHRKAVAALERQVAYLGQAIVDCEQTACKLEKTTKVKQIKLGEDVSKEDSQPDVDAILKKHNIEWNGPYTTRCKPCIDIVKQLNALPGWVVRADMQLQAAEITLKYAELIDKTNTVLGELDDRWHPNETDYSKLPAKVKRLKAELFALRKLFKDLLVQLDECERQYCVVKEVSDLNALTMPISTCPSPASHTAITVGANNEVGSSANFREKAKKKVAGLATKAITGLLGIGGGGGGKSEGPATYKDPVKNKQKLKVKNKAEKRDIRVGGTFTPDGLLISTDIKKAPGKGTFHTVYLENVRGWKLVPIRLLMYKIWADWKLSVSWTRDTYVDGELVKHEEGGWTESWRETIAEGQKIEYAEVPIWEQLGFTTAVSGARSLGTLFPVSPTMLAAEPINLVIHISDPKKDPVVTVPYVFQLSLDDKGEISVTQQEQTIAAAGTPCT